jgi:signal-transduction protein with cAMP-binding, CBS, and nucleotidyltransferase domain
LAQRLSQTRAQLLDSAVSQIVQAYLDSIANDPASRNVGLPSWTTEVAGRKFGIDSKNIYIAGLKIPAAVLALLPIGGGNIDQNRAYNRLMDLRQDLLYAARRAETLEEFKQVIREIRLRKEREREMERNQRTAPPPETPATP